MLIHLLIQIKLVFIQRELGKQAVLFHNEIGNPDRPKHIGLAQGLNLTRTLK